MIKKLFELIRGELVFEDNTESMVQAEERLLLVTKARWILIGLMMLYGVITAISYLQTMSVNEYINLIKLPVFFFLIMIAYNTFYHWGWHAIPFFWKKYISLFIKVQFIIDILIATALVHFTGGVASWFWGLYILFTLELTYMIPNQYEVMSIGVFASAIYTSLIVLEYFNIIPPVQMPFIQNISSIQHNLSYIIIAWFWVNIANFSTAFVSTYMHGKEKSSVRERVIKDGLTGLYNRRYFNHILNSEMARAKRYNRVVSLLMIDIDDFKSFNDHFGHPAGDDLLNIISHVLKINVRGSEVDPPYDIDVVCRYGGDEFAIILPETTTEESLEKAKMLRAQFEKKVNEAYITAERLRRSVEKTSTSSCENKVTISIGIASFPCHANNSKDLIRLSDAALYEAKQAGKNKTVLAEIGKTVPKDTITT